MNNGKAVLSILAGVAAGTIIGILLSPKRAHRLEKNISRKSQDLADAINDKIDEKFEELLKKTSSQVKKSKSIEETGSPVA